MRKLIAIVAVAIALSACGPIDYFVEEVAGIKYPYFCMNCHHDSECGSGSCEEVYAVDQEAFWPGACVPSDWSPGGPRADEHFVCKHVSRYDEDPWRSDYE